MAYCESTEKAATLTSDAFTPADFYHYFEEYKESKEIEDPGNGALEWKLLPNLGHV